MALASALAAFLFIYFSVFFQHVILCKFESSNFGFGSPVFGVFGRTSSVRTAAGQAVDAWCQALCKSGEMLCLVFGIVQMTSSVFVLVGT